MLRKIALPFLLLAMFSVAGGHWVVLQSIAWVQMAYSYSSSEGSMVEGLKTTFGGEKPCSLCNVVKEGRQKESDAPQLRLVEKKIEALSGDLLKLPEEPQWNVFCYPVSQEKVLEGISIAPPSPVPICAFA